MRTTNLRSRATAVIAALLLAFAAAPAFAADTDSDGLDDALEAALGTDPQASDTDGDAWDDHREVFVEGTDPTHADTDGDGVSDSSDSHPFELPSGDADGGSTPGFDGARTGTPWARSGLSPVDGEGVHVHDGAFRHAVEVAHTRGVNGFDHSLALVYDSRSAWDGIHGRGWWSILETRRTVNGAGHVTLTWDGVAATWTKSGSGWTAPAGFVATMTEPTSGNHVVTWPDGRAVTVGPAGITRHEDRFGNAHVYSRTAGRVTSVTDSRGEVHALAYYATGRLRTFTAADGAAWTFRYNTRGQLFRIEGPSVTGLPGGSNREYRYINGSSTQSLEGNLVAAADGNGAWWLRCTYDTQDRVVRQYLGGGAAYLAFDYTNASSQQVTVTDRAGDQRVWTWHATKLTRASLTERTNRNVRANEGDHVTSWTTDSDGWLVAETLPRGNGTRWTLSAAKLPTETRRKSDMTAADSATADLVETASYDAQKYWGVSSRTDAEGRTTTYTLNSKGQPTATAFPTLTHVTPNVSVTTSATYNADGSVATETDAAGRRTTYSRYTSGPRKGLLQTRTVDADGLALATTWDWTDFGAMKSVTDPRGGTTTYTVQRYGNVTKIQSPASLGYETRFTHDGNLNVLTRATKNVDGTGTWLSSPQWWTTTYTWSAMNRLVGIDEDLTATTTRTTVVERDANDATVKVLRGGRETRWTRDERGLVYERTHEGGTAADAVERWDYDGNRNVVAHVDARGKTWTAAYDLFDRATRRTNPLGHYRSFVHDKAGRVTEEKGYEEAGATDVLLSHHRDTYDAMGRRWKEEDALLAAGSATWFARTYVADGRGLVTKRTDRLGHDTTWAYDGAGRRTSETDALGNSTAWTYDAAGNVTAVEETEKVPGSSSTETFRTEFTYDAIGRRTKRTEVDRTNTQNRLVTEWRHGALGLVTTIDAAGTTTSATLDGTGRTTERRTALGGAQQIVTQWTYDDFDAVTRLRDDAGRDTNFVYDLFGNLTTVSYASGKSVVRTYDAAGNVARTTDANGSVVDQTWDDAGRLVARDATRATGVAGDVAEDFVWDALDRLVEAKDDDSIVQLAWDSLGRVVSEKQGPNPFGSAARTTSYTWDAEGGRTKVDYPSGFDAHETRDALGRLASVTDAGSATLAAYAWYGAAHRLKDATLVNGARTFAAWDGFRRAADVDHRTSGGTEFAGSGVGRDPCGRVVWDERSHAAGAGDVRSYDAAGRLTAVLRDVADPSAEAANPGSQTYDTKLAYVLDDVSNLTSYQETPYQGSTTATSHTADSVNRYTAIGGTTVAWTDAGSLKDDGTFEYQYDARERLVRVARKSDGATVATYAYDALGTGRRTSQTVGSKTTRLVYAGADVIEEVDGSGSLDRVFVHGGGAVAMMEAADAADVDGDGNTSEVLRFAYHADADGSVTHVTGPSQQVVEACSYDPHGRPSLTDGAGGALSASAIGSPYLFLGLRFDAESGLYRSGGRDDDGRMLSPALRRFIVRAAAGEEIAPNAYAADGAGPFGRTKTCTSAFDGADRADGGGRGALGRVKTSGAAFDAGDRAVLGRVKVGAAAFDDAERGAAPN